MHFEDKRTDEMRPQYNRSDFGKIVRGKYVRRLKEGPNVVVLDPRPEYPR